VGLDEIVDAAEADVDRAAGNGGGNGRTAVEALDVDVEVTALEEPRA